LVVKTVQYRYDERIRGAHNEIIVNKKSISEKKNALMNQATTRYGDPGMWSSPHLTKMIYSPFW